MRRRSALPAALAVSLAVVVGVGVQATQARQPANGSAAVFLNPGPGGFTSDNVSYVASIPTGAGVSARLVNLKDQRRLYVSNAHSLTIYDVTDPSLPVPMGALPIYNWENEDIAVSPDGNTAILTEFESSFYLHVVDTSNPNVPVLKGSILFDGSHTVECADEQCNYLFASNGKTYDIRDQSHPAELPRDKWWSTQLGVRGGHALHQDRAGYWIADETPLVMFKEAPDPLHVKRIRKANPTSSTAYQHNNIRPAADQWVPRKPGDNSKDLRPGEMLMTESETNFNPDCAGGSDGTGSFSTWSMANWDKGAKPHQLHVLKPVQGDYANGDPAVNALGCSGHWFRVRKDMPGQYAGDYLVAAGWYEHGTRFMAVDQKTGRISQVGYFQPLRGSASAAYWIGHTNYVYVIDYQRGIDILKFDPDANPPTAAATRASWFAKLHTVDTLSQQERFWCRQAMEHPEGRFTQHG
jgi:hypothetical protein